MNKKYAFSFFLLLLLPAFLVGSEESENQAAYAALVTAAARPLLTIATGATGFNVLSKCIWLELHGGSLDNMEPLTPQEKKVCKQLLLNTGALVTTITCLSFFASDCPSIQDQENFLRDGFLGASSIALYQLGGKVYRYCFARKIRHQISQQRLATITTYQAPCVICKEDEDVSSKDAHVLSCGHMFHDHCIVPWLEQQNNCPCCKKKQES